MKPDHESLVDGRYSFLDLVDIEALRRVFGEFSSATGFTAGLVSHPDQELLVATDWRDICTKFHRAFPVSEFLCKQSNRELTSSFKKSKELKVHHCKSGLVDGATPIIIGGAHVANLFTGQVLFEKPDMEYFRTQGEDYGYDVDAYLEALERVPVVTEEAFESVLVFLGEMAVMIAEQGLLELRSRQTVRTALESEERWRSLTANTKDFVQILDAKGNILYLNRVRPPNEMEDVIGRSVFEFTVDEFKEITQESIDRVLMGEGPQTFEAAVHLSESSIADFEVKYVPMLEDGKVDKIIALATDIGERKRSERALRESEERYRALVESSPDMVAMADLSGTLLSVNRQGVECQGYASAEELVGRTFFDMVVPTDHERVVAAITEALRTGRTNPFEVAMLRKDGTVYPAEASGSVTYDAGGRPRSLVATVRETTERKKAEEALRKSEENFRSIYDGANDAIFIHEMDTGRIIAVNQKMCDMYGYDPEEAQLIEVAALSSGASPYDLEHFLGLIRKAGAGEPQIFEWHARDRTGRLFWVEVNLKRAVIGGQDRILAIVRDITQRRLKEEEVRKLAKAVKFSAELVNMSTPDGKMVFLNEAGCKILGVDPDQVDKTNIMQVIPDHLKELVAEELLPTLMRGETWKGELQYKNLKTGELTDVQATTYAISDPDTGEPQYLANVSIDVTEQRKSEREKTALEAQVQHMQKLESLGLLAGGIAHDFNNLLTAILGNAEIALVKLPASSPARKSIDGIEKAAVRAAGLCNQMLAFSGRGSFEVESLDLQEVVLEITQMLESAISKKVLLKLDFADHVAPIEADASQVRQIALNLITNASEAIGEEGGEISLCIGDMECDRDYLSGSIIDEELPGGRYSYFEVSDTGSGMDEETIERVFDPFFTTKITGRGMGLSAVLGIMRRHRGAVTVSSQLGKGTTFKVLFPAVGETETQKQSEQETAGAWQGEGVVLLVDDEKAVLSVAYEMLVEAGFEVLTAADGRQALEVFKQHMNEIVLVLLDLSMPEMGGEEAFKRLRRLKEDIRVILMSGYDEQDTQRHFVEKGLAGFIQKPFTFEGLKSKLRDALR